MIKECNVISYNKFLHILVFEYEGKRIQITAEIDSGSKVVYVKHSDDQYTLVNIDDYRKYTANKNRKKKKEVETVSEINTETDNSELFE